MIKKFCLACGNEFLVLPYRKYSAKFCSRKCKHAFNRTNKKCLFCSRLFVTANYLGRRYCSRKCADEAKKKRIAKTCLICGKKYEVQKYAKNSKYCGIECRNKGISKTLIGRFKGEKNPSYKEKIIKICGYCGNEFRIYPYRKNTANYCSIRCSKLDTSKETRKKIAESIKKLQKENPKIHPNYILAQKGHTTQIEKLIKDELIRRRLKFETQYRVLNYWVDFAFPNIKLAVECDGGRWHSTEEQILKDKKRDKILTNMGWIVLRFKEKDIINNTKGVVNKIGELINQYF